MESEETTPPLSEEQPDEETQAEEQQIETKEPAKCIEPFDRVEDHFDEFDYNAKLQRYHDCMLMWEDAQHEAIKNGQSAVEILFMGATKELFIRGLRKPGRKVINRTYIIEEGRLIRIIEQLISRMKQSIKGRRCL